MRKGSLLVLLALGGLMVPVAGTAQNTHVLMISGLGGGVEYTERFHSWLARFADAAIDQYGVAPERIFYLGEKVEVDTTMIRARSSADNIRAAFAELGSVMAPGDDLFVLMVGHGTYRDGVARFNIPGPDLTPTDLDGLLDGLGERRIVFVNTATASGPFVEALSAPGRAIISATASGRELNLTRFGLHFVDAFAGDGADLDKDERVSLYEAFVYARQEVAREYEGEGQILTEHAMLDDNGDGEGTRDETGDDGSLSRSIFLASATGPRGRRAVTPALQALYDEKAAIEARIDELKNLKAQFSQQRYEDQLEGLLIQLALKNREIREAGGAG